MTQTKIKTSFLILGAGWSSQFLIPLLQEEKVDYAATTTTGRDGTIKFIFEPDAVDSDAFLTLPEADTILVTFPLRGVGQSQKLLNFYQATHSSKPHFIALGSTLIWPKDQSGWVDRHSPRDPTNARGIAEEEMIQLGGCALNLSGLWGGERSIRDCLRHAVPNKETLSGKTSLHMIHGQDVARAIHVVYRDWPGPSRWLVSDQFVYDYWELFAQWGSHGADDKSPDAGGAALGWVQELMKEQGLRALPRSLESLGRKCDSTEFWQTFRLSPVRAGKLQ